MRNDPTPNGDHHGGPSSSATALAVVVERARDVFEELLDAYMSAAAAGDVPGETGLNLSEWMTLSARLPRWLVAQIESVAQRMSWLPECTQLFRDGVLSFDDLAWLVRETAKVNGRPLRHLDHAAASAAERMLPAGRMYEWQELVVALVASVRAPGWAQRQEKRREHGNTASIQHDFDGGGHLTASLDQVSLATVETALADAMPDGDQPRAHRLAHGLVAVASSWLAGTAGGSAKAAVTVVIDLATATTDRFGHVLRQASGGRAEWLSARTIDILAKHATLTVQLTDGARPLARIKPARDVAIPEPVRQAVLTRDRGCRFPGCTAPLRMVQVHHIVHRSEGGTNDPDNLIVLCGYHHLQYVHRRGWTPTLDPATGHVTWRRRGSPTLTTSPHATQPARKPDGWTEGPLSWLQPPMPPPPHHPPPERDPDRDHDDPRAA